MLIETLGADEIRLWFMFMALVFAMMFWITHSNMRRARLDGDNDAFFNNFEPARLRDFFSQIAIVCALALAGVYLLISGDNGLITMLALLTTNGILGWQFYLAAQFWEQSVARTTDE